MDAPVDLLDVAAAALAVSAGCVTGFGLRRERPRGWLWWVLALWGAALGALLAASAGGRGATALAEILLLQWPLATLVGVRHFHARHALPGRAWTDGVVLTGVVASTLAAHAWDQEAGAAAASAGALALHLYAALLLLRGPAGREGAPLQWLAGATLLTGCAPTLAWLPGSALPPPLTLHALSAALGALVTAFVVLMLEYERSERRLRDSRRRLRALANLDALTQVPNRRHFHELALLALRTDPPGSAVLLLFDIDHFKAVNDQLGHAGGDRALTLVAGSVLEQLRAQDIAGRLGGDEFALLLRRADTAAAMRVAGRIVATVQRRAAEQRLPRLSLSVGLVQLEAGEPLPDALRRADQALYEAKRQGRSRAVAAAGDEDRPRFTESQRLGLTAL